MKHKTNGSKELTNALNSLMDGREDKMKKELTSAALDALAKLKSQPTKGKDEMKPNVSKTMEEKIKLAVEKALQTPTVDTIICNKVNEYIDSTLENTLDSMIAECMDDKKMVALIKTKLKKEILARLDDKINALVDDIRF
ncbi:MAG: hypothetical protein WC523_04155 [Patescibacteria group bacterium]